MNNVIKILVFFLSITFINIMFAQSAKISEAAINDMKYMLEEEKLAYDVYKKLGDTWNLRIFSNIQQSEARHMEMMKGLLEANKVAYQISDQDGTFFNTELQKLYNNLIERGTKSQEEAIKVGKVIEETDIADLEKAISKTQDSYAKQVYSNLLRASENHLNAFNRWLAK